MNRKPILLALLTIVTALYYLPVINLPLAPYDEAVILFGAEKVMNGQVPHRDFSSEYPLGQFYTLATLFKAFGVSVLTERIYDLAIKTLLSITVFSIISLQASLRTALLGWLMSIIWLQHSSFPAYPVYPSMLFIFFSIYLLLLHIKSEKIVYVALSAVSIVTAILFRHDLGGYAAIAITLVLTFRSVNKEGSWRDFTAFTATAVLAGAPALLYFFMHSSLGAFFDDLVLIPMSFLEKQALPYPSLSRWTLPFYVFPLVIASGALASVIRLKRKKDDSGAYAILLISFIGIFCFNQARMRSDTIHLLPVALMGILLAPILLHEFSGRLTLSGRKRFICYLMFIVLFGATLTKPASVIKMLLTRTNGYNVTVQSPGMERARYAKTSPDLKAAIAYIKDHTSADEKIYVGVTNHDQFVFNDVIIYFLSGRDSATRYHTLNPGVHTTSRIQKEIIDEFRAEPPELIILTPRSRNEPNLSSVDSQVDILDNHIRNSYSLRETFGIYEIWMK